MAEGTHMKDLQEAQKRIDYIRLTEAMKREATEVKLQEQISRINLEMHEQLTELNGKYEHLTNTLAAIQLQPLNMGKSIAQTEEESILGGPYQSGGSEGIQSRNQYSPKERMITDQQGLMDLTPGLGYSSAMEELAYLHYTPDSAVDHETLGEPMDEIQMTLNTIAGRMPPAKKLGCNLQAAKPLLVKVANGQRLISTQRAEGFTWDMQGNKFTYPLRLLKNEGCDLTLGGDWLKACTPIELDYDKITFTVTSKGKRVRILALTSAAECKFISGDTLYKMLHMDYMDQIEELYVLTAQTSTQKENPELLGLLSKFEDIFEEPKRLPPSRGIEHQIILKNRSIPKHQYPYRTSHDHRDEIERILGFAEEIGSKGYLEKEAEVGEELGKSGGRS
ncbi:hypothetical protein DH2020_042499 [Rehmannia glutinosa]|uniref:Uncharacterized protein n=1 Tax=Rehmannia glutinosa TaxID=99300 RepID=A0ABR0UM78_REHGL